MKMPPGLPEVDAEGNPLVVRLKRSLYGLRQAGREWHQLFSTIYLKELGFHSTVADQHVPLYPCPRQTAIW